MKFPKAKKRISDFLIEEDGKIDKGTLLKTGIISSAALLSLVLSSQDAQARVVGGGGGSPSHNQAGTHNNALSLNCDTKATCAGSHSHSVTAHNSY